MAILPAKAKRMRTTRMASARRMQQRMATKACI